MWASLLPLVIGSAFVPIHIAVTLLILRGQGGRLGALTWVAGMTAARLAQGLVFGLVLAPSVSGADGEDTAGPLVAVLLLVIAVLFYVAAARKLLGQPDEDAPPPRWMTAFAGVAAGRAFLLGMGVLLVGAKLWVFTLGAIAVIEQAGLGLAAASATFVLFALLAVSVHLVLVGIAFAAPERAEAVLGQVTAALERYERHIVVALGLVFGTWFGLKALDGLGII